MTSKELLKADMLDILFEHRNKLYGAYALRKDYNHRLGKALAIALSIVLFFILFSAFRKNEAATPITINSPGGVELKQINLPEKIEQPQPQTRPRAAEADFQTIRIVRDDLADRIIVENSALANATISNVNRNGPIPDGLPADTVVTSGTGNTVAPQPDPDPKPLPTYAPSFPGGQTAWLNYLRKFLQTPDALEAGQRIEVRVRFWVETDGYVSRFEIIQSGGSDFDREVLRVMKKMPKWEPAMQNGQKIAVSFTQPVIFVGVEE